MFATLFRPPKIRRASPKPSIGCVQWPPRRKKGLASLLYWHPARVSSSVTHTHTRCDLQMRQTERLHDIYDIRPARGLLGRGHGWRTGRMTSMCTMETASSPAFFNFLAPRSRCWRVTDAVASARVDACDEVAVMLGIRQLPATTRGAFWLTPRAAPASCCPNSLTCLFSGSKPSSLLLIPRVQPFWD